MPDRRKLPPDRPAAMPPPSLWVPTCPLVAGPFALCPLPSAICHWGRRSHSGLPGLLPSVSHLRPLPLPVRRRAFLHHRTGRSVPSWIQRAGQRNRFLSRTSTGSRSSILRAASAAGIPETFRGCTLGPSAPPRSPVPVCAASDFLIPSHPPSVRRIWRETNIHGKEV
jgi:hypothetical protein